MTGSVDATNGLERDFVKGVSIVLPRSSESNVRKTNRAPANKHSQTRQSQKPVKDNRTSRVKVQESKTSKRNDESNRWQRSTRAINPRKDLGRKTLLRESKKRTRSAVHRGDTERQNGRKDDGVHVVIETLETRVFSDEDERASAADENECDDHEDGNRGKFEARSPEFFFSVAHCAKHVENDDSNEKDSDPDTGIRIRGPVLDGDGADC
ncbi:hypothetical protein HG531_003744 [Fusarium graminearum]|nr:hypothetical protein HG531_003744 [Fusarium graminearum]